MSDVSPSTRLFRLIVATSGRLRARMDARLAPVGLTTQQAAVLTLAEGAPEPLTQGELARRLGTSHQNVRQLLDALVRKGLVQVEPDPADRRARRIRCTDAVGALFADRHDDHVAVRRWLSGLSDPEVDHAVTLLAKLLAGLDAQGDDG